MACKGVLQNILAGFLRAFAHLVKGQITVIIHLIYIDYEDNNHDK